jgi:uncharacterized repeat protein (TIGR01451 family)
MNGKPYDKQILFSKNTNVFTSGRHTMGVAMPVRSTDQKGCFYQVDLTYGDRIHSPVLAYGHGKLECERPGAKCEGLDKVKLSRNEFNFTGHASVQGGAKVKSYTFTARDKNGKIAAQRVVKSDNLRASSGKMTIAKPGDYTVRLVVNTTVGEKSDPRCVENITVNPEQKPGVSVTKKVNNKENVVVGVNQIFTYQIVVKNTGNAVLKNVAVKDVQPNGVTFVSASAGTISGGAWNYTIGQLNVGESKSFTITAKIPTYLAGTIKNTVCVDAPSVPGNPDDCDDAHVRVPQPQAVCVIARTNYINRTDFTLFGKAAVKNDAHVSNYVFTIRNAAGAVVKRETVASTAMQATTGTLSLQDPGVYAVNLVVKTSVGDRTAASCNTKVNIAPPNMVQVCDPQTRQIITVPESEAGNYLPPNDPACQPPEPSTIDVCELSTKNMITINEQDFNPTLHSKNPADCEEPEQPETPEQPGKGGPETLVDTGVGAVMGLFASLTVGGALAHRLVWARRY